MDILQGILGMLGQFVDVAGRGVDLMLRPEVLAVLVGLIAAIGVTQSLKRAPFMVHRESAERKRARAWWLRVAAFAVGAVLTALIWPGSLAARVGVGLATGFMAPVVYDVWLFVLGKLGIGRKAKEQ